MEDQKRERKWWKCITNNQNHNLFLILFTASTALPTLPSMSTKRSSTLENSKAYTDERR